MSQEQEQTKINNPLLAQAEREAQASIMLLLLIIVFSLINATYTLLVWRRNSTMHPMMDF